MGTPVRALVLIPSVIVDLAFGLTFGAVAVAAALAFGRGSRETAGRFMEDWTKPFESRKG